MSPDHISTVQWNRKQLHNWNRFFLLVYASVSQVVLNMRSQPFSCKNQWTNVYLKKRGMKWSLTANPDNVRHKRVIGYYFPKENILFRGCSANRGHTCAAGPLSSSATFICLIFPLMMGFILHSQIVFMPPMPFMFLAVAFC